MKSFKSILENIENKYKVTFHKGDGNIIVKLNGIEVGTITKGSTYDRHFRRQIRGSGGFEVSYNKNVPISHRFGKNVKDSAMFIKDMKSIVTTHILEIADQIIPKDK